MNKKDVLVVVAGCIPFVSMIVFSIMAYRSNKKDDELKAKKYLLTNGGRERNNDGKTNIRERIDDITQNQDKTFEDANKINNPNKIRKIRCKLVN